MADLPGVVRRNSLRLTAFAGTLLLAVALVAVVVRHDRESADRTAAAVGTVVTVPVPSEILVPVEPTFGTAPTRGTGPRRITHDQVQVSLEQAIKRTTGWTHKVICQPAGELVVDEVLECAATTEPPIAEVQPSRVLVVVIDASGRFVWHRGVTGPLTMDALGDEGRTCAELLAAGYSWVAVLAYDIRGDRPASLDRDAAGRPCVEAFGDAVGDAERFAISP